MNTHDKLMEALEDFNEHNYLSIGTQYTSALIQAYRAHRDKPGIWLEEVENKDEEARPWFIMREAKTIKYQGKCYRLPQEGG